MLTVKQISQRLGVSTGKVRNFIRSGELPAVNVGAGDYACFRVTEDDLNIFMGNRKVAAPVKRRKKVQITEFV